MESDEVVAGGKWRRNPSRKFLHLFTQGPTEEEKA